MIKTILYRLPGVSRLLRRLTILTDDNARLRGRSDLTEQRLGEFVAKLQTAEDGLAELRTLCARIEGEVERAGSAAREAQTLQNELQPKVAALSAEVSHFLSVGIAQILEFREGQLRQEVVGKLDRHAHNVAAVQHNVDAIFDQLRPQQAQIAELDEHRSWLDDAIARIEDRLWTVEKEATETSEIAALRDRIGQALTSASTGEARLAALAQRVEQTEALAASNDVSLRALSYRFEQSESQARAASVQGLDELRDRVVTIAATIKERDAASTAYAALVEQRESREQQSHRLAIEKLRAELVALQVKVQDNDRRFRKLKRHVGRIGATDVAARTSEEPLGHQSVQSAASAVAPPRRIELPFAQPFVMHTHERYDQFITASIRDQGAWELLESEVINALLSPGDVFYDVGANIGWYSVMASIRVGPTGRVFAFEPEPLNFQLLTKNVLANGASNVFALQAALSNYTGMGQIHLNSENLGDHLLDGAKSGRPTIDVWVTTLGALLEAGLPPPKVIKLDTQGSEDRILSHLDRLRSLRPDLSMVLEFWPFGLARVQSGVEDLLKKISDFDLYILDSAHGRIVPVTSDTLRQMSDTVLHPSTEDFRDILAMPRGGQLPQTLATLLEN